MIKIAPSLLAADFAILKDQIEKAEAGGADWFHLDIMDGHFVPNITFGPIIVEAVRKLTALPLDVHLMIANPDQYIQQFIDAGANVVTVHAESTVHLHRSLNLIKKTNTKAGVALNPSTPICSLENIINDVDLILAMSVNPGFGGQIFISQVLNKIRGIAELVAKTNHAIFLEVDGGIDGTTAPDVVRAGANVLVAGSAIFKAPDISKVTKELKTIALEVLQ